MQNQKIEISSTRLIKIFAIVGGILLLFYYGKNMLLPVFVAAIIATLLNIPVTYLKNKGMKHWLAMLISLIGMVIIFSLLFWLIFSQVSVIAEDWPEIQRKGGKKLMELSQWSKDKLGLNYQHFIGDGQGFFKKLKSVAGYFLSSVTTMFSQSLITFVYVVLFLLQKNQFIGFFMRLTTKEVAMSEILSASAKLISSYLLGKGKIMTLLFGIYYVGFEFGGVPYALFLALFAALFSIIPYVGNIIGGGIAVILSYTFAGSSSALLVVAVISAAQLLENYVLTPWIIGEQIDLNPFITVFGVLLYSSLWGVVGAIISLPLVGVIKTIFEYSTGLEAYAYLMKKK